MLRRCISDRRERIAVAIPSLRLVPEVAEALPRPGHACAVHALYVALELRRVSLDYPLAAATLPFGRQLLEPRHNRRDDAAPPLTFGIAEMSRKHCVPIAIRCLYVPVRTRIFEPSRMRRDRKGATVEPDDTHRGICRHRSPCIGVRASGCGSRRRLLASLMVAARFETKQARASINSRD